MNVYSYPVNKPAIYATNPNLTTQQAMPSYHVQGYPSSHHYPAYPQQQQQQHQQQQPVYVTTTHRTSPRAHDYAYSYPHSSPGAYTATSLSGHSSGGGHHHRRSHSTGPTNTAYLSPATHYRESRRSPGHTSTSGHGHTSSSGHGHHSHGHGHGHSRSNHGHGTRQQRASSATRYQAPVVADARGHQHRRSTSHTRAGTYVTDIPFHSIQSECLSGLWGRQGGEKLVRYPSNASYHRRDSEGQSGLGDRLRRMFGFGPERRVEFVDPRTAQPVDMRGRQTYRV